MTIEQEEAVAELLAAARRFADAFPDEPTMRPTLARLTRAITEWMSAEEDTL